MRRVYECTTYVVETATCTAAAWVERQPFPELTPEQAGQLLGASLMVYVACWGWRQLRRQTGIKG